MAYYGIANFANDFNQTRDNALNSGLNEDQNFQKDFLGSYSMPAKMDALDQADFQDSINLDKLAANQRIAQLQSEAIGQGYSNPNDIAGYIRSNVDASELAANPYLGGAVLDNQRQAAQNQIAQGGALGGSLGSNLVTRGLNTEGLGLQQNIDANGNVYFTDANGNRSDAYSRGGQVPITGALNGNTAGIQAYNNTLDTRAYNSATLQAQIAAGKYNNTANAARLNALRSVYIAQAKTNPAAAAQTLRQINALLAGQNGGANVAPSGIDVINGAASLPTATNPGAVAPLQAPLPPSGIPAATTPLPSLNAYGIAATPTAPAAPNPMQITQDALAGRDLSGYGLQALQNQYDQVNNIINAAVTGGQNINPSLLTIRENLNRALAPLQAQQDARNQEAVTNYFNTFRSLPIR